MTRIRMENCPRRNTDLLELAVVVSAVRLAAPQAAVVERADPAAKVVDLVERVVGLAVRVVKAVDPADLLAKVVDPVEKVVVPVAKVVDLGERVVVLGLADRAVKVVDLVEKADAVLAVAVLAAVRD